MSENYRSGENNPVVALYTPFLQGAYVGELVNQIRQLTFIKGYKLVIIRTGGYGKFNEPIHLGNIDAVIIIRNAIAPDLAETLIESDIACVSIAYDYFPLKMPMVTSDNAHGVSLAFDHLNRLGHQNIAFVGDLSQYDIRKRYEYYCELHDQHELPLQKNHLISVNDALFSGGISAAKLFLQSDCDATAIIFGAGLTGVGFIRHMHSSKSPQPHKLDYVCFDALSMIPVFTPEMTSVDQNLHLIAYRALNAIDSQLNEQEFDLHTAVIPKLTRVSENPADSYNAFIATCIDLPELHNPNYMKSLISNMHDWPREILHSQLDQLMSVAPLFEKFMGRAVLSRYFIDTKSIAWIKTIRIFAPGETSDAEPSDSNSLCKATDFPPRSLHEQYASYDTCIHMPIITAGKLWGLLSFFGDPGCKTPASSYYGFAGYVESILKMYEQDLELKTLRKRIQSFADKGVEAPAPAPDCHATVEWSVDASYTSWSEAALAKLGYTSPIEVNIYQHMDITDRIHPDDFEKARAAVAECKASKSACQFRAKYRTKSKQYTDVIMQGEPQLDEHQNLKSIIFSLDIEDIGR